MDKTLVLNWGREIINDWSLKYIQGIPRGDGPVRILDIGAGCGTDLLNIRKGPGAHDIVLYGIETYEPYVNACRKQGIEVFPLNIENSKIPLDDGSIDMIIINQVIEHTKEIFWIFSEISRVLKNEGRCIVGVPNLAALHERVLLLFGFQPRCIKLLGPHMRGYTKPGFRQFIEKDGYFTLLECRGSNFFPLPETPGKLLCRLFPTLAVSIFFLIERTARDGVFIDMMHQLFYETNYYAGGE